MFARLGTWCHDRRRLVVGLWLAALIGGFAVSGAVGDRFREEFNLPDRESTAGLDVLDQAFGGRGSGATGTIVFRADQGVDDPEVEAAMSALFARVARIGGVERVESPYADGGERLISSTGDQAGRIAYANVEMPSDIDASQAVRIRQAILAQVPDVDGLRVELGGMVFAEFEPPSSETLGLAFAIVILIVAFGSVMAMGLPVGVALFGIGSGAVAIVLLSNVVSVPELATVVGVMIGLGVGIDYALLIVTRFREQLHAGHTVREAVAIAHETAGRSVLFAGTTVVISLLGMLLMGVRFIEGLGIGAATVVAVTVTASLTLLPALLGFTGAKVERTRRRGILAAGLVALGLIGAGLGFVPVAMVGFVGAPAVVAAGFFVVPLKREVRLRAPKPLQQTAAYRWSRVIQHRPWQAALAGTAVLAFLAVPTLGLRLGFADESNFPEDTTTKQAYDLLVAGFGEGFNGPLLLVAELPPGVSAADLRAVTEAVGGDPGVAFVSPPQLDSPDDPTAVVWQVVPTRGPQSVETTELVDRLRGDLLPPLERQLGDMAISVTGTVAVNLDFADFLGDRMPVFFGAVLTLSFLLLLLVFRSLLVPFKAVVMNLLSIGAAYGVVVALFQWGWLSDLTGVHPAPIEPWAPMMLFAIVFGLSMDYEVFLLSRVREEWRRTGDSRTSVADGLAATAKVITAAAAIMVFVFGSFVGESDRGVKMMGVGLAVAIFLDATVVRMLLVPATMELLGDRNWWLPRWVDRVLPRIDVEGHAEVVPAEAMMEPTGREPVGAP